MDSVGIYINKSKDNLINIVKCLEDNIEFLNNDLWASLEESNKIIEGVINIYYDKYFLYNEDDFDKISNYMNFNKNINRKLKTILLSIIDYYETIEQSELIRNKESSILYLNILIYTGLKLYDKEFIKIDEPKKIEKEINNIIDNFAKIRFKRSKDLINLIDNIKNNILYNNKFNNNINKLNNIKSHNSFMKINEIDNYYKVLYAYKIKELNEYVIKDKRIVENKLNMKFNFNKISFDICYYTMFKLLKEGSNIKLLFPITKDTFNENTLKYYISNRNKEILKNIKFIIDYNEIISDYNFINMIKANEIDLFIEVNKVIETNNYNMFMDIKNIVCPEEFVSINEKYLEIWKDMNMKFMLKNLAIKITEESLLKEK